MNSGEHKERLNPFLYFAVDFVSTSQGVLRIEVLEAKDLVKKDIGVFKKGSSDPYAILRGMSECHLICGC